MFDNILDAALSKWLQHTPSDSDHIVISSHYLPIKMMEPLYIMLIPLHVVWLLR